MPSSADALFSERPSLFLMEGHGIAFELFGIPGHGGRLPILPTRLGRISGVHQTGARSIISDIHTRLSSPVSHMRLTRSSKVDLRLAWIVVTGTKARGDILSMPHQAHPLGHSLAIHTDLVALGEFCGNPRGTIDLVGVFFRSGESCYQHHRKKMSDHLYRINVAAAYGPMCSIQTETPSKGVPCA